MNIIADAFGGDNAPLEILRGCRRAADKLGVTIALAGPEDRIRACAAEHNIPLAGMEILHAPAVFEMGYEPQTILREHGDTSMAVGLKALAGQGYEGGYDAFVSAGSTGALLVGATLIVKRIRGVRRAAIAAVMPSAGRPFVLLDAGANAECTAEMLGHFALLGSAYARHVLGVGNPRVGLVNIGTEENKGDPLRQEAHALLSGKANINFTGNIEAREIPLGGCDVAVADGFTGNVVLKLYEGMGKLFMGKLKGLFLGNPLGWLSAVPAAPGLLKMKKQMDYKEYGGAPLLGIDGVVIKAHGSSDAKAVFHAVRQAKACVEGKVAERIREGLKA
ncbi:MAG: phosphate acyltransferase PlsX [Oscillospiraceae bacterium]|jgi:glycerol-3-phosphate acyltransferase PlsX|nr:phosphate acyltransferase PlsX [Oscillospiraceae bacterium]